MATWPQQPDISFKTLILTALYCSAAAALYAALGTAPDPLVEYLMFTAPVFAVILWVQRDARRTGVGAVYDWGFFLALTWPVLLVWYAFRTRGRTGWRLLLKLAALAHAAYFTAYAVGLVRYGIERIIRLT